MLVTDQKSKVSLFIVKGQWESKSYHDLKRHSTLSFLRTVIVVYLIVLSTILTLIDMHVIVYENKFRECVQNITCMCKLWVSHRSL